MSVPQRFHASSVRGAMSEAKRALGPEALIIEHRLVNGRVELLAMAGGSTNHSAAGVAGTADEPAAAAVAQPDGGPQGLANPPADAPLIDRGLIEEIELALPRVPESTAITAADAELAIPEPGLHQDDGKPLPLSGTDFPSGGAADMQRQQGLYALREPAGEVEQVLEAMGFSTAIQSLLSEQAVTPRLAINELVTRCRYSSWPRLSGLLPVIGAGGTGVTTSLLRLALSLRSTQPRLKLHAAMSDTLAGSEKLLLGAQLLGLDGSRLAPDALRASVAGQVPAELALLDLSLSACPAYTPVLRQLQQQGLIQHLVLVVPLHWQPAAYLKELSRIDLLWDRSCAVHVMFTGADRSARLGPWLELALRNDWALCRISSSSALATPAEPAAPAVLRRLLLPQIDRPEASTIFTEELLRERGA